MDNGATNWWRSSRYAALSIVIIAQAPGQAKPSVVAPSFELSCASFSATTSEADLVARFGKDNVVHDSIVGSDDGPQPGTVLFPKRPEARAKIFWNDPDSRLHPLAIDIPAEGTAWKTVTGVVTGMTLKELERRNGRLFRMSGFWREGGTGGTVISWQGGRLEPPKSTGCELRVQLQPPYDGTADQAALRQVQSGPNYSSGHPALQRLNPRVVSLGLWFP